MTETQPHKTLWRILLGSLLSLAAGVGIARWFNQTVVAIHKPYDRPLTLLQGLPQVAHHAGSNVVMFGSCIVEDGFSPGAFDTRLASGGLNVTSWNLGISGANFDQQLALARRYKHWVEQGGTPPHAILLEFTPKLATVNVDRSHTNEPRLSRFLNTETLWEAGRRSPLTALRLFGMNASSTPELGTLMSAVKARLFEAEDPDWYLEYFDDPKVVADFKAMRKQLQTQNVVQKDDEASRWEVSLRGEKRHLSEADRALQRQWEELVLSPVSSAFHKSLILEETTGDLEDLNPAAIESFVQLIRTARTMTPNVFVVVFPQNWSHPNGVVLTDVGTKKVAELLKRFSSENATVIEFLSDRSISERPGMYYDLEHLNVDGRLVFSEMLADRIAPHLSKKAVTHR